MKHLSELLSAALSLVAAPLELAFGVGGHPRQPEQCTAKDDPYAAAACLSDEVRRYDSPGPKHEVHGQLRTAHHYEGQPDPYQPSVRGVGLQEWPTRHLTELGPAEHAVGDFVEVYWEGSTFAIPHVVIPETTVQTTWDGGHLRRYHLHNAITNSNQPIVPEQLVHPYRMYAVGTEAYCNVANPDDEPRFVPCTVVSAESAEESATGSVRYEVAYPQGHPATNGGGVLPRELSWMRLQRIRTEEDILAADEEPMFASIFD